MHYLVDGYNLLFRLSSALEDFTSMRESIIQDLNRRVQRLKMDVVIVFDAQYSQGEASRTHYNYLEILFSGKGETADDLIIKLLKRIDSPQRYTVVTSDKHLAWEARHLGAKTESVEAFLISLNKRYINALKNVKKEKAIPKAIKIQPEIEPIKATPEECFDYYLSIFEQNITKSVPREIVESDMERWLRLFEKKFGE